MYVCMRICAIVIEFRMKLEEKLEVTKGQIIGGGAKALR